jgi:hypothetical protein
VNLLAAAADTYGGPGVNVGKAILELRMGVPAGPPRYPGSPIPPAALSQLRADLDALGFFAW